MARRFQAIHVPEPSVPDTISIIRGIKDRYEIHHGGIRISDAALVAAAAYSNRYITDRFLHDKAIDLVDEAASALRLKQESKPDAVQQLDREIMTVQIELQSLRKATDIASRERREHLEETLKSKQNDLLKLSEVWNNKKDQIEAIKAQSRCLTRLGLSCTKLKGKATSRKPAESHTPLSPSFLQSYQKRNPEAPTTSLLTN